MKQTALTVLALAAVLALAGAAQAATFTWTGAGVDPSLTNPLNWAPSPGTDDFNGTNGTTFGINSGGTANSTGDLFAASLAVNNGGALTGYIGTAPHLYLNGGTLNVNHVEAGSITVTAGSTINVASDFIWYQQNVHFTSASGFDGTLTKTGSGTLGLNGDSSTYFGNWKIEKGGLLLGWGSYGPGGGDTFEGALGNQNPSNGSLVGLEIASGAFVEYGNYKGDYAVTVDHLILGGVAVAPGTYDIEATYGSKNFADYFNGTGTIEVVPEPATMSLIILGGVAALIRRRRK
ncbi:MAG: PEP-CTERM sorting domain-containing protein [Planctomycetaceae bacterium]|nr:PEP-CTERM sorting domain-containing protein [Planctomycetaceae bacterium]